MLRDKEINITVQNGIYLKEIHGKTPNLKLKFINCEFKNPVYLLKNPENIESIVFAFCNFNCEVKFYDSQLKEVSIAKCDFFEDVELNVLIEEKIFFKDANLKKSFKLFSPSSFNGKLEFKNVEFSYDEKSNFNDLNFGKEAVFSNCNLINCLFDNSDIKDVRFLNCNWDFLNALHKNDLIKKYTEYKKNESNRTSIKEIIISYREFEINLDKSKDYEQAGEFHKKRYELEYLITNKTSLKKVLLFFINVLVILGKTIQKHWFGLLFFCYFFRFYFYSLA